MIRWSWIFAWLLFTNSSFHPSYTYRKASNLTPPTQTLLCICCLLVGINLPWSPFGKIVSSWIFREKIHSNHNSWFLRFTLTRVMIVMPLSSWMNPKAHSNGIGIVKFLGIHGKMDSNNRIWKGGRRRI